MVVLKGTYKRDRDFFFMSLACDRTRGNDFKLKENWFTLHMRRKLLTTEEVR